MNVEMLKMTATQDGLPEVGKAVDDLTAKIKDMTSNLGALQSINVFGKLKNDGTLYAEGLKALITYVDQLGVSYEGLIRTITKGKNKGDLELVPKRVTGSDPYAEQAERVKAALKKIAKEMEDGTKAEAKATEKARVAAIQAIGERARALSRQELAEEKAAYKQKEAAHAAALEAMLKRARNYSQQDIAEMKKVEAERARNLSIPAVGSINNQLGGMKESFTNSGKLAIDRANKALVDIMTKSKISETRLNEIFKATRNNDRTVLDKLSVDEEKLSIGLRRLSAAFDQAGSAGKRTQNIMIGLHGVLRLLEVQQIHTAISNLQNYFTQAGEASLKLAGEIALIQTISQKAQLSTNEWSEALIRLSSSYGLDVIDVAKAGYEAVSNQIAQGAAITPFLAQAFEFARATSSTAAESVDLLSSALNGYNLGAESVQKVSAILFKTIELGRVKASELASVFGNTTPIANALGISLEELGAGIATLTIQGVKPNTALTLMNNIMLKLLKPTKDMQGVLNEWGVASGEAAIKAFGFAGVLQKLDKEFERGGLTRIAELAGDMRAIRAEAGLLAGGSFEKFTASLAKMKDGQVEYEESVRLTADSLKNKLAVEFAKVNNLFTGQVGTRKNEIFLETIKSIGGLEKATSGFADGVITLTKMTLDLAIVASRISSIGEGMGLTFSRLAPVIFTSGAAFSFMSRVVEPASVRLLTFKQTTNALTGVTSDAYGGLARLASGLGLVQKNAAGTALQFSAVGLALGNIVSIGIPAAIAAWTYYTAVVEEAERKRKASASNALNELAETDIAVSKRIQQASEDMSNKFTNGLKEDVKTLNLYYSIFQAKLNQVSRDAEGVTSRFAIEDFENSLIGQKPLQRLTALAGRFKEIGAQIQVFNRAANLDGSEKSIEKVLDVAKKFREEQQRILDTTKKVVDKLKEQRADKEFEYSIFNKSARRQYKSTAARSSSTADLAAAAEARGDLQLADELYEQAIAQREKAQGISEGIASKRGFGRPKGLADTLSLYDSRIKLNEKIQFQATDGDSAKAMEKMAREWHKYVEDAQKGTKLLGSEIQNVTTKINGMIEALDKAQKTDFSAKQEGFRSSNKSFYSNVVQLLEGDNTTSRFGGYLTKARFDSGGQLDAKYNDPLSTGYQTATKARKDLEKANLDYGKVLNDTKATDEEILEQYKKTQAAVKSLANAYYELGDAAKAYNSRAGKGFLSTDIPVPLEAQIGKGLSQQSLFKQFSKIGELGRDPNEKFGELTRQLDVISKLQDAITIGKAEQKAATEELRVLLQDNLPQAFKAATETLKEAKDPIKAMLDEMTKSILILRDTQRSAIPLLKGADGPGKALGGMLSFASGGGFIGGGLGRDNQLIRAHAGEFIVNAESAAMFRPQLVAMNSFGQIPSMNSGGPITQVGDIHINANLTGQTDIDVIALGKQLRREIKRGTVRLN